MLENDLVDEIALADLDELVASFWKVVFSSEAETLADRCLNADATLEAWRQIRASDPSDDLGRAFKCLFLNRTSFSGILNHRAGPLGGWTQAQRALDCRFPRYRLADRIRELSSLDDIANWAREGRETGISLGSSDMGGPFKPAQAPAARAGRDGFDGDPNPNGGGDCRWVRVTGLWSMPQADNQWTAKTCRKLL